MKTTKIINIDITEAINRLIRDLDHLASLNSSLADQETHSQRLKGHHEGRAAAYSIISQEIKRILEP